MLHTHPAASHPADKHPHLSYKPSRCNTHDLSYKPSCCCTHTNSAASRPAVAHTLTHDLSYKQSCCCTHTNSAASRPTVTRITQLQAILLIHTLTSATSRPTFTHTLQLQAILVIHRHTLSCKPSHSVAHTQLSCKPSHCYTHTHLRLKAVGRLCPLLHLWHNLHHCPDLYPSRVCTISSKVGIHCRYGCVTGVNSTMQNTCR
jgi:hypothetical protein